MEFLLVDGEDERIRVERPVEFVHQDGQATNLIVERVGHLTLRERGQFMFTRVSTVDSCSESCNVFKN